jgi:hypothetical protein
MAQWSEGKRHKAGGNRAASVLQQGYNMAATWLQHVAGSTFLPRLAALVAVPSDCSSQRRTRCVLPPHRATLV